MEVITKEHVRWQALYDTWLREGKPAVVMAGVGPYQVVQTVDGEIEFRPVSEMKFYESTSL